MYIYVYIYIYRLHRELHQCPLRLRPPLQGLRAVKIIMVLLMMLMLIHNNSNRILNCNRPASGRPSAPASARSAGLA